MPVLVKLAKTGNTIYYAELARRTGIGIKFPLVLKYPLGAIGRVLISLSKETGVDIPPLQSIVVNQNHKDAGGGIDRVLLAKHLEMEQDNLREMVFRFERWDWVLQKLEISPQ
jgi:hypothetical protein